MSEEPTVYRSGQIVPRSGVYASEGREATLIRGGRFPPATLGWVVVRWTHTGKRRIAP